MTQSERPPGFARAWAKRTLLPLCALVVQAQAQNFENYETVHGADTGHADVCLRSTGNPIGAAYYQMYPATTIQVGQNAKNGDLIGSWITTSMAPAWKCKRRTSHSGIPVQVSVESKLVYVNLPGDAALFGSVIHDGESYRGSRLGDAPVSEALGYIARWRATIDGTSTDWTPLNFPHGDYQPGPVVTVTKNAGDEYFIQVETQIHFIKRKDPQNVPPWNGQYLQGIVDPTYSWVHQQAPSKPPYNVTNSNGSGQYIIPQMLKDTVTFIKETGTCTTPSVAVGLPDVGITELSGPGTIRGTKDFDLEFQNCPKGLYGISYYFTPTTTILDEAQGVIALDGNSTATGVALKLTEDNGTALKFGQPNAYQLAYDPSTVKTYPVPLKVAYYQTDNTVTPGDVTSSITVTLKYQ